MRVIQLVPTLQVGGAERIAGLLCRHLKGVGHDVALVSLYPSVGGWIEQELREHGVDLHFLDKRAGLQPRVLPRLWRVLRRFQPDVVHTHMYALKYLLAARAPRRGCAVVHTLHNVAEHEAPTLDQRIQSLAFRRGVVPVAIGDAVARSFEQVYGFPTRHTIPNGVPVAAFAPPPGARAQLRSELGIAPQAPVFVTVGRFKEQKNHALLLRAFGTAALQDVGAHLLLAGEGELRQDLERQAQRLGLGRRVHFLGVRSDVPRVLAASDVFVLASHFEGNPLVVMEAMAAGLPVVSTSVGCVPELVSDQTGRLVPPGAADALASQMQALAADLDLAHTMGQASLRQALARFDVSIMGRAYERLYLELL